MSSVSHWLLGSSDRSGLTSKISTVIHRDGGSPTYSVETVLFLISLPAGILFYVYLLRACSHIFHLWPAKPAITIVITAANVVTTTALSVRILCAPSMFWLTGDYIRVLSIFLFGTFFPLYFLSEFPSWSAVRSFSRLPLGLKTWLIRCSLLE